MGRQDAIQHFERATEATRDTSFLFGLLGSAPNHLLAASEFEKAANHFRSCHDFTKFIECCIKCAESHAALNSYYLAGEKYEQAGGAMDKHLSDKPAVVKLYQSAGENYVLAGASPNVVKVLEKAALVSAQFDHDAAVKLYQETLEYEDQSLETTVRGLHFCMEHSCPAAIPFSIKLEEAYFQNTSETMFYRQVLITIFIYLAAGDYYKAEQKWLDSCSKYICI
jgi:tetratricopeptide (TPR) repeat protein